MNGHWNDEQLIQHLYGVGPADSHLDQCQDCQTRLSTLSSRAAEWRQVPELDGARLLRQRQAVMSRLEQPSRWWMNWKLVPAGAAAMSLVVALAIYAPSQRDVDHHQTAGVQNASSVHEQGVSDADLQDAKLFVEVSDMASSEAPVAANPARALLKAPEVN